MTNHPLGFEKILDARQKQIVTPIRIFACTLGHQMKVCFCMSQTGLKSLPK